MWPERSSPQRPILRSFMRPVLRQRIAAPIFVLLTAMVLIALTPAAYSRPAPQTPTAGAQDTLGEQPEVEQSAASSLFLPLLQGNGEPDEPNEPEEPGVAPTVAAGADLSLELPDQTILEGSATGAITTTWSVIDGPGAVWFGDPVALRTSAEFTRPGVYTLQLTAANDAGEASDTLTVTATQADTLRTVFEGEFPIFAKNAGAIAPRITTFQGNLYVAYVDRELRTVVAARPAGASEWEFGVVEPNTVDEDNHRKPALGIDRDGYIHVVYNMHNSPWQYKVSVRPGDVSEWAFRGQLADSRDNDGTAAIPGRQITYPNFASDKVGNLWISFRECLDCNNSAFFERRWSGGIARYDVDTRTWERVGGTRTFAEGGAYRPQYLKLFFDQRDRLHMGWVWGQQYAGGSSEPYFNYPNYPTYVYSDDGGDTVYRADGTQLALPLTFETSEQIFDPLLIHPEGGYQASYFSLVQHITADSQQRPWVVSAGHWTNYTPGQGWLNQYDATNRVPFYGSVLKFDRDDNLVAISAVNNGLRGITIHRSTDGGATWRRWQVDASTEDNTLSNPDYWVDETYFLHTGQLRVALKYTRGPEPVVRIFTIHLPAAE